MRARRTGAIILVVALVGVVLFTPSASVIAATLRVDCDAGQRLQPAIDQARPGDQIVVTGFCSESIIFREEAARITLDGGGTATIHGPLPAVIPVAVRGRGITIRGFTITGGRNGINVVGGGTAVIDRNVIQETGRGGQPGSGLGINVAQHSYAIITGNTIQSNPGAGINVIEGSYARIGFADPADPNPGGNIIRNNGTGGVRIANTSGAAIAGNTISENGGPGVSVSGASNAIVSANRIESNEKDGVTVTRSSSAQLGGGAAQGAANESGIWNLGFGISCTLNSSATGRIGTLNGVLGRRDFDNGCSDDLTP